LTDGDPGIRTRARRRASREDQRDLAERGRRARRREGAGEIAVAPAGESLPLRHIITTRTFKP